MSTTLSTTPPEQGHPSVFSNIEVVENQGQITGIAADYITVHGDIYSVYMVKGGAPGPTRTTPPYKFLAPYTFNDHPLFKGREDKTREVTGVLTAEQIVVLWGKAGVGKTSLLCAGIIPQLIHDGALVVELNTYNNPLGSIRKALGAGIKQHAGDSGQEPAERLKELVIRASAETNKRVVIVLDQFELLFKDPPAADSEEAAEEEGASDEEEKAASRRKALTKQRDDFVTQLAETLDGTEQAQFCVLIAVDEADVHRVLVLQSPERKARLKSVNIELPPLREEDARQAIFEPLRAVGLGHLFDKDLVNGALLPDLISMGAGEPLARDAADVRQNGDDYVYPPYLQIVCHTLYLTAKGLGEVLKPDHYLKAKGADGIFANYVEETVRTISGDEGERLLARQILEQMAAPELKGWIHPSKLNLDGAAGDAGEIFGKLVEAKLLSARTVNGQQEYVLSNPAVLKAVRNVWGTQAQKQFIAREELEHLYASWLLLKNDGEDFVSAEQLRFLARYAAHLPANTVRALLLLRAASALLEPTDTWLGKLKESRGAREMIERLEDANARRHDPPSSDLVAAKLLLGIMSHDDLGQPRQADEQFMTVAQSAVLHKSPAVRQTAAISLLAMANVDAAGHVEGALNSLKGWARRRRSAELRGAMLEADPSMVAFSTGLRWTEQALMFLWLLWRNAYRDRVRLFRLTIGGALGVGLALGLLRAVIAKAVGTTPSVEFVNKLFYGTLFGGFISFGLATLKPFALTERATGGPARRLLSTSYGAAFLVCTCTFGLAQTVLHYLDSKEGLPLGTRLFLVGMSFVASAGISWAVAGDLDADGAVKVRWGWKYLGGPALVFLLAQVVFILTAGSAASTPSLNIYDTGWHYASNLGGILGQAINKYVYGGQLMDMRRAGIWPAAFNYVSAVDAALTGLVFAAGLKFGLSLAGKSLHNRSRWPDGR